jgi:hypothetical protein
LSSEKPLDALLDGERIVEFAQRIAQALHTVAEQSPCNIVGEARTQ